MYGNASLHVYRFMCACAKWVSPFIWTWPIGKWMRWARDTTVLSCNGWKPSLNAWSSTVQVTLFYSCVCMAEVLTCTTLHSAAPIGHQIIGDNCDLHQHASHVTLSSRDATLHWFQMYAVCHRVIGHNLTDEKPKARLDLLALSTWLPSEADCAKLRDEFVILIARILLKRLPQFQWLHCVVPEAIPHQYSEEMAEKSEIVSINN